MTITDVKHLPTTLTPSSFGGQDAEQAEKIRHLFYQLQRYVEEFYWTLGLVNLTAAAKNETFEEVWRTNLSDWENAAKYSHWNRIALGSAVLIIHHFKTIFGEINAIAHRNPGISIHVNNETRKAATRLFAKTFPDADAMRNAFSHESLRNIREHEHGTSHGMIIEDSRLTMTWQGRNVSITVTNETFEALRECYRLIRVMIGSPTKEG